MAAVNFSCPRCAGVFRVPDSLAGQSVTCPHCRSRVALPAAPTTPGPGVPLSSERGAAAVTESIAVVPPQRTGATAGDSPATSIDVLAVQTTRPGAKERRRLARNMVLWGFGMLIIGLVVGILSILGPIRRK